MALQSKWRSLEEARTHVDQSRKSLYLVGGVAMLACGVFYYMGMILSLLLGPAPTNGQEYLTALSTHVQTAQLNFLVFSIVDLLLIPVTFALYFALKAVSRNTILMASALMILFSVFDLGVTELTSFAAVSLSQSYAAATTDVARASYIAAANYALAVLPVATFLSYVISSVGILIIGIVMIRGVFLRIGAVFGIATGIVGTLGGFYIFVPSLSIFLLVSLVLFGIWTTFSGLRLVRLGVGGAKS